MNSIKFATRKASEEVIKPKCVRNGIVRQLPKESDYVKPRYRVRYMPNPMEGVDLLVKQPIRKRRLTNCRILTVQGKHYIIKKLS